jgi:hypothetical protein
MSDCVLIKTWATMDAYELSAISRYTLLHGIQEADAEIERLRATLDQLLRDAQQNGFIGDNIDDAIAWAVRQIAAANKLRREIQRRADLEPGGHVLDDDLRKARVTT